MPDGENELETWDAKYTIHSFAVATLFAKCEAKYREFTGSRAFHLVLYAKATRSLGDLVVCRADRYAELLEAERRCLAFREAFINTTGDEPREG